jgi:hypothetical protein
MQWQEFIDAFLRGAAQFAGLFGCLVVCGRSDVRLEVSVGADTKEGPRAPTCGYDIDKFK